MSHAGPQAALVWVRGGAGPVGVGFLVGEREILTCAHVVNAARGMESSAADLPANPVSIRFALLGASAALEAEVVEWHPPVDGEGDDGKAGDIALLRLKEAPPGGAAPTPLVPEDDASEGKTIIAFGAPEGHHEGEGGYARGTLAGKQGSGWIQIDGDATGYRIQPGFSGSPAWANALGGAVGMIVAAEYDRETRVGWLIPTSTIVERCPSLVASPAVSPPAAPPAAPEPAQLTLADVIEGQWVVEQQTPWGTMAWDVSISGGGQDGANRQFAIASKVPPPWRAEGIWQLEPDNRLSLSGSFLGQALAPGPWGPVAVPQSGPYEAYYLFDLVSQSELRATAAGAPPIPFLWHRRA